MYCPYSEFHTFDMFAFNPKNYIFSSSDFFFSKNNAVTILQEMGPRFKPSTICNSEKLNFPLQIEQDICSIFRKVEHYGRKSVNMNVCSIFLKLEYYSRNMSENMKVSWIFLRRKYYGRNRLWLGRENKGRKSGQYDGVNMRVAICNKKVARLVRIWEWEYEGANQRSTPARAPTATTAFKYSQFPFQSQTFRTNNLNFFFNIRHS